MSPTNPLDARPAGTDAGMRRLADRLKRLERAREAHASTLTRFQELHDQTALKAAQDELEQALTQARADLDAAEAELAQAKEDIAASQADLERAMSDAQQARADAAAATGMASQNTQDLQDQWNATVEADNAVRAAAAQDAQQKADAAKLAAVTQAATDATTKADAAQAAATTAATQAAAADAAAKDATIKAAALAEAATTAQQKADAAAAQAKADALTAAATDAKAKADKALTDAKVYADQKATDQAAATAAALQAAQAAQAAADQARAVADGAIRTWFAPSPPWPDGTTGHDADIGDLLYRSTDGVALRWNGSKWETVPDTAVAAALKAAQDAQATADGKIDSFYQPGAPTSASLGDLWFDTDDKNKLYRCSVASTTAPTWTPVVDGRIADAQNAANAAQQAADAAAAKATSEAAAAKQAAIDAAALDAAAKASQAKTDALTAAAADAKAKADAAQAAAVSASATDANAKADAAQAAAVQAAAADAAAKASAAETAAKQAAAADAKTKADAAQAAAIQAAKDADAAMKALIDSRGTDLVTNGTGLMGTNANFSAFTVDKLTPPPGASAGFASSGTAGAYVIDEFMPYDGAKKYQLSFSLRQMIAGATNRAYGMLIAYDQWNSPVYGPNVAYLPNTTTTLAADLKPGDTTIKLASAANWYNGSTSSQYRTMIVWGWTDPNGKVWPKNTYTRRCSAIAGVELWNAGAVDTATNTITLKAPWPAAAGTLPVGTEVSNGNTSGWYFYMPACSDVVVPETWATYSNTISKPPRTANDPATDYSKPFAWDVWGMPHGTAKVKIGWLLNYAASPANPTAGKHEVGAVSFSDAAAAQVAATAALTSANGRNSRITSNADPYGAPNNPITGQPLVNNDTWFKWDNASSKNVIGQWRWDGTAWQPEKITDQVIASLDVNKLVVTGNARIAQAVIEKLVADLGYYKVLTTDVLNAGQANLNDGVAQKFAIALADIIRARVENLVVTDGATINEAVIMKLAAAMIATKSLLAGTPTGARIELSSAGIQGYDDSNVQILLLDETGLHVGEQEDGVGRLGAWLGPIAATSVTKKTIYGLRFTDSDGGATGQAVYGLDDGSVVLSAGSVPGGPQYKVSAKPDQIWMGDANNQKTRVRVDADGLWTGTFRNTPKIATSGALYQLGPGEWIVQGGVSDMPTSNWGLLTIKTMDMPGGGTNWVYTFADDLGHGYWTRTYANGKWTAWRNHIGRPDGGGGWSVNGVDGWRTDAASVGGRDAASGYVTYRESGDSCFLRFAFMWLGKVTPGEKRVAVTNRFDPTGDVFGQWQALAAYGDTGGLTLTKAGDIFAHFPAGTGVDNLVFGGSLSWIKKAPVT